MTPVRALALLLAFTLAPAQAQTPAPAPSPSPAVSTTPDRTTATYGDWVLRCERPALPAGAQRICEVAQSIQVQGQQAPIAQVAIGRLARTDPLKVTLVLPTNVTLTTMPKVAAEEKDGQLVDVIWQRCQPNGCFAEAPARDDLLKRMRAGSEPGRIEFRDATGRDIKLPLSLRGIAQALDAMAKE